jgi:hypothetical protein
VYVCMYVFVCVFVFEDTEMANTKHLHLDKGTGSESQSQQTQAKTPSEDLLVGRFVHLSGYCPEKRIDERFDSLFYVVVVVLFDQMVSFSRYAFSSTSNTCKQLCGLCRLSRCSLSKF